MNSNKNDIEKLKMKIAIFNTKEDIKNRYLQKNNEKKGVNLMKKKIIATACASLVLVSGIALAANIENIKKHFDRGLGNGIETAVENGYIEESEAQFTNINNVGIDVTLENFLMDDTNLSVNFVLLFDDILNETINLDKSYEIELKDLIVRDEENRILYGGNDKERFETYCIENKLDYKFEEFNENYMNSGVGCFIESKGYNNVNLLYNIYSDNFPKSKKLYFSFTKLSIAENEGRKFIINGNWQVKVDVPEKMYNRKAEYYKVTSCNNDDFEVYTAKLTDTGFEFGVIISNIEKPESDPMKLTKAANAERDYKEGEISEEEYKELREYFLNNLYLREPISTSSYNYQGKQLKVSYVENEKAEKFEPAFTPGRRASYKFLEGNKYDFSETFEMTKYNATDKIKVILYYYEDIVTIELEKINK